MRAIAEDLRYAFRNLRTHPGTTAVAAITLAIGIGANTAIFSVIDKALLHPLPFRDSNRLVHVWSTDPRSPVRQWVSFPDFVDWRRQAQTLEGLAAWFLYDMTLVGSGDPLRVKSAVIYGDLFALLGVPPALGRTFRVEQGRSEGRLVVISDGLWRRRFGSDPDVVGRGLTLSGESYTVAGVMPQGFQFPVLAEAVDVWASFGSEQFAGPTWNRGARLLNVIGRLKTGVAIEQAQVDLDRIGSALRQQYPDTNSQVGIRIVPAIEELVADVRLALLVLFGVVVCVLLIACVNVANLLLARAADRRQEIAVRAALGASRLRLGRQLLTEYLLLALVGGGLGALLAVWGVPALLALVPGDLPRADAIGIDVRVLQFTLLASLLTGFLFGLTPAWRASRINLVSALRDSGSTHSEGPGARRLRGALVVGEIALALILLTGAALLINSFWRLGTVDPGIDPRDVLAFKVSLPYEKYNAGQAGEFFRQLQERLEALPGVHAASTVLPLPLNRDALFDGLALYVDIEGRPVRQSERPLVDGFTVQPHYLRVVGIELRSGRDFNARDTAAAPRVAIISETLARRFFPGEDAIGKRIRLDSPVLGNAERPARQIVGVVADVKHRGLSAEVRPQVYTPLTQDPFNEFFVVVKTESSPRALVAAARSAVLALDKEQPIAEIQTLEERVGQSIGRERFNSLLLTIFSSIALLLASVGLYGVMSYAVARRTHEFGIRMALGADLGAVLAGVVREGLTLVLAGVCIGWIGALVLTRLLQNLLFGVSATEPMTFAVAALLLTVVALLACWVPARSATKVDPVIALRCR